MPLYFCDRHCTAIRRTKQSSNIVPAISLESVILGRTFIQIRPHALASSVICILTFLNPYLALSP